MNRYYNFAIMTCCTFAARSDRLIIQPTRRVRCMVVVTMRLAGLFRMTVVTVDWITGQNHAGYCCGRHIVELAVATVILMAGRTAVIVMQRGDLGPGADRIMTVTATRTVKNFIVGTAVITYRMTGGRRMRIMTVKVRCMTL